jgi:hypothetical protein
VNHLILTLGCHRSGTSLIAKSLECFGVSLGPNADWSGPDNPRSFAEDRDVLAINEEILSRVGSAWDDPTPLDPYAFWPFDLRGGIDCALCTLLERHRFPQHPLFGLKEPRLCRLLPAWRNSLDQIGCKVSAVHVVRHPHAVAKSLEKRNGIPIERGLALWLEYTRRARLDVDPTWRSVTVSYDRFMADPVFELARLGTGLGLQQDAERYIAFLNDFVDHGLQHHHPGIRELPPDIAKEWALAEQRAKA